MNLDDICARLNEELGGPFTQQTGIGDPWITFLPAQWKQACLILRDRPEWKFNYLRSLCCVDRLEAGVLDVVVHLFSYQHRHALVIKTEIPREGSEVETLSDVWPAANWHERECFDLFGVQFIGHPDLRRLLLPDGWVGHPLRKDYKQGEKEMGLPTQRPGYDSEGASS